MNPRWLQWEVFGRRLLLFIHVSQINRRSIRSGRTAVVSLPHKAAVAPPPPSPSIPPPLRQAAGGMLRLVFSHSLQAAGLQRHCNVIGPLSKHAFYQGCVQGRADSGNAPNWGKVLPRPAEPGWILSVTFFFMCIVTCQLLLFRYILCCITGHNKAFFDIVT